jgi:hypothetical protein
LDPFYRQLVRELFWIGPEACAESKP